MTITQPRTMQAALRRSYGDTSGLRVEQTELPRARKGEVLIRVEASSVNPADRYMMLGSPKLVRLTQGLFGPKRPVIGTDVAGTVAAVGPGVDHLEVGARVIAASESAWAEYAVAPVAKTAIVPAEVPLTDAGVLPIAGCTALQALDKAEVAEGSTVLINGASGGVGHVVVQLAKARGAHVTAVCSAANRDFVAGLGADEVLDYVEVDYPTLGQQWDVIVDNHGNHSPRANLEALVDGGRWVLINGPMTSEWWGPLRYIASAHRASRGTGRRFIQFTAHEGSEDLARLVAHVAAGELSPHIEQTVSLEQVAHGVERIASGRTRGKVAVSTARHEPNS